MANNPNINFVKFLRGTQAQYDRLVNKDQNTLYFIYDKTSTDEHPTGKLYLDKFLIGGNSSDLHQISLSDLSDTTISTLTGTEVLQFDKTDEKWKPVLLSNVVSGLLPPPVDLSNYIQAGDIRLLTEEQRNKLNNLVFDENGQVAISGTVSATNVQGLDDFITQHQYIKSVDTSVFNVTNNGKLELKSDYITTDTFYNVVGDINALLNPVSNNSTIINEINTIKESVIWQDI